MERIYSKIKISDHASDILAVEIVVSGVDGPGAPVGVVIAVGTGTEGSLCPQRR